MTSIFSPISVTGVTEQSADIPKCDRTPELHHPEVSEGIRILKCEVYVEG